MAERDDEGVAFVYREAVPDGIAEIVMGDDVLLYWMAERAFRGFHIFTLFTLMRNYHIKIGEIISIQ